jgi:hypothetical protein
MFEWIKKLFNKKVELEAEEMPVCTTAPSAEHTRASDEDAPCDDARGGNS